MAVKKNPSHISDTGKLLKIHKIYKPHPELSNRPLGEGPSNFHFKSPMRVRSAVVKSLGANHSMERKPRLHSSAAT